MNLIEITKIIKSVGVFFSVCRAIGLPCKSVTCFDSAHDTDGSTTIDYVFTRNADGYLKRDRDRTDDSIW